MDSVDDALLRQKHPIETTEADEGSPCTQEIARPQPRSLKLLASLVTVYSFLLIFSWTVTCILTYRPLDWHSTTPSWGMASQITCASQTLVGGTNSEATTTFSCGQRDAEKIWLDVSQLSATRRWRLAARMIASILAVLTIPFSSFIAARAAVVYAQTADTARAFSLRKMLALADRGWWNPFILMRLVLPGGWRQSGSPLLLYAFAVCALGTLNWPLQQLLVSQETIFVATELAEPTPFLEDADITGLSQVHSVMTVGDTRAAIEYASQYASQPSIWRTPESQCNTSMSWAYSCATQYLKGGTYVSNMYTLRGNSSFVSVPANSITTGIVEDHAFRFNTTVVAEGVPADAFPDTCGGSGSFSTSSVANLSELDSAYDIPDSAKGVMEFRVCAMGDSQQFPWNLTRNRQDIEEEAYIQFNAVAMSFLTNGCHTTSWTQQIRANTTAGYFMLPNYQTNNEAGPLLETFNLSSSHDPENVMISQSEGMNIHDLNNSKVLGYDYPNPTVVASPALGPLLTATIALFGPSTFFANRANSTPTLTTTSTSVDECSDPVPFSYISETTTHDNTNWRYSPLGSCASPSNTTSFNDLNAWLTQLFANYDYPETSDVFTQAAFFANKANLGRAATVQGYSRILFKDEGTSVDIFHIRPWAIALISVIVGLHVLGLAGLTVYAGYHPTWTESFDSFAMLRIGAQIAARNDAAHRLPLLGHVRSDEMGMLDGLDGFIGEDTDTRAQDVQDAGRLVLGGRGRLRRGRQYLVFRF
ncbi:hypothetical protein BO70DRAFT_357965 [Aspergillus heteromorphus CBS 117.55]|uniref:Uncharacterized protein n=1 Tax=Aspergillus heteromorphus CBS 117.55 TaxID=1448321 RepID=A0A317X2G8_9EURO|nr:uncharacterized protein BO70DRAFT_357965 [Aspergillus heteromorphus CBS 117.55]PWY92834.1 hypothetical protein BO70DRAFT_357965 [Aspergillus heteromorphus CBS 117.55]